MSTQRQKILYAVPTTAWGGAGRYVYDLARNLKEEYDIVAAVPPESLLAAKLKREHIRTIELSSGMSMWRLYRLMLQERPDIVHLNATQSVTLLALSARLAGVSRVVFTAHGWSFNEPVPWLMQLWRWCTTFMTMVFTSRTIAVSHFSGLQAPLSDRVKVIHNGIEEPAFLSRDEAREALKRRIGKVTHSFWVGTIAELHPNKGVDILIQAAYLVDDIEVIIIGEGEARKDLEKLIADLDLKHRVHLLGFVDEAARYLKAFDTFTLPSRTEALGYVLIEAGMAEVPVIAAAVGGIPEIITDQITGDLVHAYSDVKLAESLTEFKETPNTIRRYADALHQHVSRYFSLHGMIKRTREVYEH
jgi:glycosyltransferase involved in cell wall biosynthesis